MRHRRCGIVAALCITTGLVSGQEGEATQHEAAARFLIEQLRSLKQIKTIDVEESFYDIDEKHTREERVKLAQGNGGTIIGKTRWRCIDGGRVFRYELSAKVVPSVSDPREWITQWVQYGRPGALEKYNPETRGVSMYSEPPGKVVRQVHRSNWSSPLFILPWCDLAYDGLQDGIFAQHFATFSSLCDDDFVKRECKKRVLNFGPMAEDDSKVEITWSVESNDPTVDKRMTTEFCQFPLASGRWVPARSSNQTFFQYRSIPIPGSDLFLSVPTVALRWAKVTRLDSITINGAIKAEDVRLDYTQVARTYDNASQMFIESPGCGQESW